MTALAESRSPARTWAVRLVVVGLMLGVLSGHSFRLGFPVPPDRVLLAAGVALLALTGHFTEAGQFRWRWVHTFMVGTVAWATWSALVHDTLLSSYGFYALLDRLVVPFALFALAPVLFASEADRRVLLKALVMLGIYLGLTALFEILGPQSLVFPRYIMDPNVGILFGRARGPAVSSEANGMILAAAMLAALLAVRKLRGAWRLAAALAIPLCAVGILLTLTRSVWLGTVVGLLVVGVVTPSLRRRLPLLAAGVVALVAAVLVTFPSLTDLVVQRLTTERSVFDRQNTNAAALRMIEAHPIDGVGWMRFVDLSADWVRQADTYPVTNVAIEVHNVVLSRAAELGVIGAALWISCVVAGPVLAIIRRPQDGEVANWRLVMLGFACVWAVTIMLSPTPYPLPNNLLWLLAGMVLKDHLVTPRPSGPALAQAGRPGAAMS